MLVNPVINCSLTISIFSHSYGRLDQAIVNFLGDLHLLGFTKFSVLFYTRDFTWFLTHKLLFACKAIPGQDNQRFGAFPGQTHLQEIRPIAAKR
jgi:hypothetical protein